MKINDEQKIPDKITGMSTILNPKVQDQDFLIGQFAYTEGFYNLAATLDYRNILSFVTILIKEALEYSYPNVDNLLNKTISVIGGATVNLNNVANRQNDINKTWQTDISSLKTELNSPNEADIDKAAEFMKAMVKAVANMTDPTWKTEWFLPGPLTPFGIIAKLLDWAEDVPAEEAEEANNFDVKQVEEQTKVCEDNLSQNNTVDPPQNNTDDPPQNNTDDQET